MKTSVFRIILATVFGEALLILLTTVAQEVLFDGISYSTSSDFDIYVGGLATFVAAVLAGVAASLIVKGQNHVPQLIITFLISAETTYLIVAGKTTDPIWADALAGLSLVVGVWLGHFIVQRIFLPNK